MRASNLLAVLGLGVLLFSCASAQGAQVDMRVATSHPFVLAGQKQTVYLKVGLTGHPLPSHKSRPAVNVAIVLDRSGSMSGGKLEQAKDAAIMAIDRLGADDIVSVVAYDDTIQVLVPATKVRDRASIYRAIRRLRPGGSTALFAGVSRGASEVRKFLSTERVNRVILLSDGLANVGPSTPEALGELGSSLIKEGISVSTIGLGLDYNEDLMVKLARRSDGNHVFVEGASHLARIFNLEFGDILSVVARDVTIYIYCARGVRPVRVLGRDADIAGQQITIRLNQVLGKHEKFVLLELEMPAGTIGGSQSVASVKASYMNVVSGRSEKLSDAVSSSYSGDARLVERNANRDVMVSAVSMIAVDNNERAMRLRDQGRIHEARKVLMGNKAYLDSNAARYKSKQLKAYGVDNAGDAKNLAPGKWKQRRKRMRDQQMYFESQRSY